MPSAARTWTAPQARAFHAPWEEEKAQGGSNAGEEHTAVVLSKRLEQDFVENTLMPHLEAQLLDSIHVYTPAQLAQIARVYSKQETKQRALCQKLSDTVKFRMPAFEAVDIIDILGAMWILAPDDDELWEMLEQRIIEKLDDFAALNFMGIVRIYNKRAEKHHELMSKVIPRLREQLSNYEGVELSEMLVSMAQSGDAAADMDILMTIVPEIERRYEEVSLVHAINNIWALTQLKMVHSRLLERVAKDLNDSAKTKDLPPMFLARIVWVYRRCNSWDMVSATMLPLLQASAAECKPGDFARLAQAVPEEETTLRRIADVLVQGLDDMGRKEFLLFFLGCVHGELMEDPRAGKACPLTAACITYAKEEQDGFKRDEVQKIVYMLHHSPKYNSLLDDLPASWNEIKTSVLDFIRAKG